MQPAALEISTCPGCGGALEKTSGGGLGCMACLLRFGIGGEDPGPKAFGEPQDSTPNGFGGDERFGIYEIERREDGSLYELGRGAMGVTYRAIDTSLQRKVALKIIRIGIAGRRAEAHERFMREARMAAALRHENIATVFQFGIREETGQCFYAMELIEGETLEERVRRMGPLDVRTTIHIAQQVTAALVAAEKRGLIHRDLKPANLMLVSPEGETGDASTQRGGYNNVGGVVATALCRRAGRNADRTDRTDEKLVVKIIDFGLAKALNTQADPMSLSRRGFVGTPAFASPEQFEHSALDVRSDVYSLGVTLWFALTGKTPFGGRSVEEIRRAQKSDALPIEQLKAAHVPSRLRSLLESMLAREPAVRPGTHDLAARLRHCAAQANRERVRRTRIALAAGLILILGVSGYFVFPSLRIHPAAAGSDSNPVAPEKSIAVLPFEDLSRDLDLDNAFFADGVQDDILTKLAKVADLKVISRTSVTQYRGKQDLRQIGRALGVSYVLEGTVRRSGANVHVNAQLVDARTGTDVWAEEYDRDLNEVFAIEAEIAQSIANRLGAKVSTHEKMAMQERPTGDLVAHDLYVHAVSLIDESLYYGLSSEENLFEAVELLNQAIARDPAFLLAYCELARAHDGIYWEGIDHTPRRLDLAKSALNSAFQLKPDSGEAHLASAVHFYNGHLDYDRARDELAIAGRTMPNNARIFEQSGYIDRRQGRWADAVRNFERAIELDPRNGDLLFGAAFTYVCLGDYKRAREISDRGIALPLNNNYTRLLPTWIDFHERADTRPWRAVLETILTENPASARDLARGRFFVGLYERDPAAADRALATLDYPTLRARGIGAVKLSPVYAHGLVARMKGDAADARAAFSAARTQQEKAVRAAPDDASQLCFLGLIDAGLGRKEEALREARRAVELLPYTKDALNGTEILYFYAVTCAWIGEPDLAIEQLEILAQIPAGVSYGEIRLDPFWDPLRSDPRFEKIVASLAPNG
jgi:serine/threonine protein kinase/tetratricopeptide (TPR) repeat protein